MKRLENWSGIIRQGSFFPFLFWVIAACGIGLVMGLVGSGFHLTLDWTGRARQACSWLMYLLPFGGIAIAAMYHFFGKNRDQGTDGVLESIMEGKPMSWRTAPMIFLATVLTHVLGGSSGREGAALQLGGSLGSVLAKPWGLSGENQKVFTACGAAGCFSALFGTPVAAAIFILEFTTVGTMCYSALVPCLISAFTAYLVTGGLGIAPTSFPLTAPEVTAWSLLKILALGILLAGVGILFCVVMEQTRKILRRMLPNAYLRAAVGGLLVVVATLAVGTRVYQGTSTGLLVSAMAGESRWFHFLLKLLFTALTLGAGFKGGEIVPSFVVGATFGCAVGPFLGLEAGFAAALGMVGVFCAITNCPIASVILGAEIFGAGLGQFALVCAVTYMLSGYHSLYGRQTFRYAKHAPRVLMGHERQAVG